MNFSNFEDSALVPVLLVALRKKGNYQGIDLSEFENDCFILRGNYFSFPIKFLHSRKLTTDSDNKIANVISTARNTGISNSEMCDRILPDLNNSPCP